MPITQDRMIALISAGRDYKQALDRVTNAIGANVKRAREGMVSPTEALFELEMYEQVILLLNDPLKSASIIEIEAAYFKRNARRNEAAAAWHKEDREAKARGEKPFRKAYKPDKGLPDNRPHAPMPATVPSGLIREIKPGERPDLDAEIAAALGEDQPKDALVQADDGQVPD